MTKRTDSPWVDEAEAATLCGMTELKFRSHLPLLEGEGFPKPMTWNGKRWRKAIMAFWDRQNGLDALLEPQDGAHHDEEDSDIWGTNGKANSSRERRASR